MFHCNNLNHCNYQLTLHNMIETRIYYLKNYAITEMYGL